MPTELKKDWKKIARANGFAIPDATLARISQTLDELNASFGPLARALGPENEPATSFQVDAGAEEEAR